MHQQITMLSPPFILLAISMSLGAILVECNLVPLNEQKAESTIEQLKVSLRQKNERLHALQKDFNTEDDQDASMDAEVTESMMNQYGAKLSKLGKELHDVKSEILLWGSTIASLTSSLGDANRRLGL